MHLRSLLWVLVLHSKGQLQSYLWTNRSWGLWTLEEGPGCYSCESQALTGWGQDTRSVRAGSPLQEVTEGREAGGEDRKEEGQRENEKNAALQLPFSNSV